MQIAVLFDSKARGLGDSYGCSIRDKVLSTDVLQCSGRRLTIATGDVNVFTEVRRFSALIALSEAVYFAREVPHLFADRVRNTYGHATVFAWRIDNIDNVTAHRLHNILSTDPAYLGWQVVDNTLLTHRYFYSQRLLVWCRIQGRTCVLKVAFEEERKERWIEIGELRQRGFIRVRRCPAPL